MQGAAGRAGDRGCCHPADQCAGAGAGGGAAGPPRRRDAASGRPQRGRDRAERRHGRRPIRAGDVSRAAPVARRGHCPRAQAEPRRRPGRAGGPVGRGGEMAVVERPAADGRVPGEPDARGDQPRGIRLPGRARAVADHRAVQRRGAAPVGERPGVRLRGDPAGQSGLPGGRRGGALVPGRARPCRVRHGKPLPAGRRGRQPQSTRRGRRSRRRRRSTTMPSVRTRPASCPASRSCARRCSCSLSSSA